MIVFANNIISVLFMYAPRVVLFVTEDKANAKFNLTLNLSQIIHRTLIMVLVLQYLPKVRGTLIQ